MRLVKVVKDEDNFLTVTDKETGETLLITESWFWFMFVSIINGWRLK